MTESRPEMPEMLEMIELLVMLKDGHHKDDVIPLAEAVQAQILEVRMMFDNKVVGLMAIAASAAPEALQKLQQNESVQIAQVNRTYKHS